MTAAPTRAWVVLAAWAGLMTGVGAALRPAPPSELPQLEATTRAAAWTDVIQGAAIGRPTLFLGRADCPCDGDARRTVAEWARGEGLAVSETTRLPGIALADAEGQLRYAGDPAALVLHCGGLRGFRAWWSEPVARPILTAPCACI